MRRATRATSSRRSTTLPKRTASSCTRASSPGRDLPRGLHRRHRPRRDRAGRARGGAGLAGHGHCLGRTCNMTQELPRSANTWPKLFHPAVAAVQKSGASQGQGRGQRHRRHPARQVPACRQVPGRGRAYPAGGFGFCDVVLGWDMMDTATTTPRSPAGSTASPMRWRGSTWTPRAMCPGTTTYPFSWVSSSMPTARRMRPVPAPDAQAGAQARREDGLQVMTGMEFEWFNFLETPQSWAAKKGVAPRC
jgi:hypothetical protein